MTNPTPPPSAVRGHIDATPLFNVGDPRPEGYLAFHAWAEVQHKGGLRQALCPRCRLWKFPQESCFKEGVCDE